MKILMKGAAHLISAYNGEEALEAANRELPDIILMDLRMPVMDGFESIQQLKSDTRTKGIPILAVTAQAMNQDKESSLEAGADGFVTKPIQIESLKEEMWRVLGAKV
jgi:two-component system chemotaxis sensor kinase CheA